MVHVNTYRYKDKLLLYRMKGSSIFLLLFGIILFGLAYYFLQYSFEEGFIDSPITTIFESDKFLNNSLNPVVVDYQGYSNAYKIKEDFKLFINDWHNFSGFMDITPLTGSVDGGYIAPIPQINYTYYDINGNSKTEIINGDIQISKYIGNGAPVGEWSTDFPLSLYFGGMRIAAGFERNINSVNYVCGWNGPNIHGIENKTFGAYNFNSTRLYSNDYIEHFNKYIKIINDNSLANKRSFLNNLTLWNVNGLSNKINPTLYTASGVYNAKSNKSAVIFKMENVTVLGAGGRSLDVDYDVGTFKALYPSHADELVAAQNEKLRLYIYGTFCNYHSTDFQECIHWGSAFDFSDPNLLDSYLNISYDDIYFNGSNVWYSYGLFYPEVKPNPTQNYLYISNAVTFNHNTLLKGLVDYGYAIPTITIPTNLNTTLGYDGNGYINSITYPTSSTRNYSLQRYNPDGTVTRSTSNTTFYTTLNTYYLQEKTLQEKFVGIISPEMLSKMPNMMHRYVTSWVYNRTQRILDSRLVSLPDNTAKATFLRTLATNNSNRAVRDSKPILATTWNNYITRYNAATLNDNTIGNMTADFKASMPKLLPNYGMASNINILDKKMLDSIAQSFYEYSDGLFEITYIYDVYLVSSNMMDIRFDKKQRLASYTYVTLRNQYIPQINAYNNLLDMYNNGTWVETYSNITDLQSNISTSLKALDPVLNPIYALNNANPDTLRTQINQLTASNTTLKTQIDIASMNTAEQIKAASTNTAVLTNLLLNPGGSPQELTDLQSKYDDNDNTIAKLTKEIDGIETNVARIFFTMTNSSNLIVNGLALGPHAALTYNKVYNASLQVDMGESLGNVNYSPTIIYTKNILPVINPSNINFIKQAAQLYMDAITTSLSSFTRNTFQNSNGIVRVDRVYGFTKLDDFTCGFTWQESQYDFYTNKPNVQRVVDVALKFTFDNIEYQNPQIFIDNKVSNIYLNSSDLNESVSRYYTANESNIQEYRRNIITLSNEILTLQSNNSNIINTFSNYLISNTVYIHTFSRRMVWQTNVSYSNNIYFASNAAYSFNILYSNTFNINNLSNFFNIIKTLKKGITSNIISVTELNPVNIEYPDVINDSPANPTLQRTFYEAVLSGYRYSVTNIYNPTYTSIIGKKYLSPSTDLQIYYATYPNIPASIIINYDIDYSALLNNYYYNLNTISVKSSQITYLQNNILNTSNLEINLIANNINGAFKFGILQNNDEKPFTLNDYINNYKNEVYYPPFENVFSNYRATSNISLLSNAMTDTNVSNAYVIIPWEPQEEETLDNNEGACPANMVCGSPQVINQLMDSYNLDSNNDDKIVRILKAFTPNSFQCDYSVEMVDSNNTTKKGTISFQVAQNIEDCSYLITSNSGFNTGYYILDKVKYVKDSATDISGYQYVNQSLLAFSNNVKTLFNPLITSASNAASDMYNAFASSRLLTYTSLGKLNVLSNIGTCGNIDYNKIQSLLYDDKRFLYSIFDTYPFVDSHMNKIIRVGLREDNMLEIIFERINLGVSSNIISEISRNTAGALYSIEQDTPNYCSYITNFLRLSTPSPPSMIRNISTQLNSVNYNSQNSDIYDDLNIVNPKPIQKIDPVNKRIIKLLVDGVKRNDLIRSVNSIISYNIINPYTVYYIINISYDLGNNNATDRAYNCQFTKTGVNNIFNINSINTIDIYNIPSNLYRTTISKNITNTHNTFILNNAIDYNNVDIRNLSGLPNICAHRVDPVNNNICDYYLNLGNDIPIEKKLFKVTYYTDNWLNSNSSNIAVYSVVQSTYSNTLFNIDITGIDRNILVNTFKTYYESKNEGAKIANFHSIDSVIGGSLITNVSIIYLDNLSNIVTDKIPNIKAFSNDKFFKLSYFQEPSCPWNNTTSYKPETSVIYNGLYYISKFLNRNIQPDDATSIVYGSATRLKGELYWGTGIATNPNIITLYNYQEVNKLSNATSYTYSNSIPIPSKNTYIDNMFWNYVKFKPISLPQLSQFEFYKDNVKLNIYVKPTDKSLIPDYSYMPNSQNYSNTYSNSYNALFNYNNVNTSNSSNIKSIAANISMALVYPTNFNGFSITTGRFRTILNWSLQASIDGSNWVTLMNAPEPYFQPRQQFYRSPLYNFKDNATNFILAQNPYYGLTIYECAIQLNITPISPIITNLYNTYNISEFNNDMSSLFENNPTISAFQNLDLVYYLTDYDNNNIYNILKTLNTKTNTYIYLLYSINGFTFSSSSGVCGNLVGNTPELHGLIPEAEAQKLITGTPRAACGPKPTIRTIVDSYTYNYAPWWRKAEYDQELATRLRTWEVCTVIGSNFTVVNPAISVFTGTTPPIYNADKFCTNYSNNDLAIIASNYIGGAVPVRFDTTYIITHKKIDRATRRYSYILSNINYRKIYQYNNTDEEGIIYYTDSMPLNTIIQNYTTSNIITAPNDLTYTTLGPCELILTITGSNYTILECAEYMDKLLFVESSNYTATLIPINTSVASYASLNNFIFMTTSLSNSVYAGASNILTQQFNLYDSISNIKNNCGLKYTNQDILQLSQQVPLLDRDRNPVADANGNPIYTFSYGSIFNGDIITTLSNTYNFSLTSDTEPYITYGKQDLNDSLKYYYIVCIPGTDTTTSLDKAMYAEYSIKFYYGTHSNRNYSNYTFITNGGQDTCTINTTITFQNLHTPVNIATYSATANYEPLGRMVQYNICSNYINTAYHGLSDFATTPSVSPVGFYDSSTEMTNTPSFYYSKLAYTRDRINPYFKKDFVYACYIMGDFKNPLFLEYNIKINSITNCSNIDFSFNYKRILTVAQFNNLSNQNYIKYNDPTNFNNRQQLSNCGINYNYMLSNFIVDNVSYSPTNINFSMIQSLVYPNLENLDIDLENIESQTLAYTKYDYKDGISIFSYILNLNGRSLTEDLPTIDTIDYSIYIFYNSSNCETLISGIQINNSNITTNISQYVTTNSYIANSVGLTQSQLMLTNGLDARAPIFVNTVNNALSNLRTNAVYQNNIFTIQYIQTDYTNLQNKYLAVYWSPDTPITLDGLIGTSPLGYLGYTITLSNIVSSDNYNYSLNSVPTPYNADFDTNGWSNGMTGKFYKNGVVTNTSIRDFSYNASNCFNYYSPSNSDIVNFIFSGLDVSQFTLDLSQGTGVPLGIYAYKKDLINSNFSYILDYKPASTHYYPIVKISLGNASDFTPTSCTDFFTTITSPDGTSIVNVTYVSGSIPTASKITYANVNGYTRNYISNVPSDSFQDYNPSESFADYHIRDPIKKKIETYSYLSLTATNNFRVNGFTLYTIKDSEVLATLVKTDVNSIIVQNIRNSVIVGYSFITNSISPEYDPKEWILKGTNDGRSWTTLDSRKLGKALTRNYQMPLLYLNGNTKVLPQPLSRLEERVLEQDSSIDKSILIKYYKQRINPSVIPDYKKFMYDKNNKVHYFLHDSYDLNKNLIGKNLIIGFVLQDDKVKKPILYENEDGTQVSFDMTKKHMKQFWEKNIMLPLVFQDF